MLGLPPSLPLVIVVVVWWYRGREGEGSWVPLSSQKWFETLKALGFVEVPIKHQNL